jgi:mannose-6-phosphate isomerase-like protein (cupin superfamily)
MAPNLTNTTSHVDSLANITFDAVDAASSASSQDVKLIYPTAASNFRTTTFIIPQGSKFHPGAHWHEQYDEIMRVVEGRMRIRLDGEIKVITPEDGDVVIKKGVVHEFWRADVDAKPGEGDEGNVVIEERSEPCTYSPLFPLPPFHLISPTRSLPVDGSKELFFRHVFSANIDNAAFGWKLPIQMLLTISYSDMYLELVSGVGSTNWYIARGVNKGVVGPLAWVLGLRPFYGEYTPERLSTVRRQLEERYGGKKKV